MSWLVSDMGSKAERLCSVSYPIDYPADRIRVSIIGCGMSAEETAKAMMELSAAADRVLKSLPGAVETMRYS